MNEAEEDKEDSQTSRTTDIDVTCDALKAQLAAPNAAKPATQGGASFTPINRVAGNAANVIDPALQAFFPNKDFSTSNITFRHDVWPNPAPAQSKDKPNSIAGKRRQVQQYFSKRNVEAKPTRSGEFVQNLAYQQPETGHRSRDPGTTPVLKSGPRPAVLGQAKGSGLQVPDLVPTTKASKGSARNTSAEAVRTFNSHFTIQKRPRAVSDLPRKASTVVLPPGRASLFSGIRAQASKPLKRVTKREAERSPSPSEDLSNNDAIPRKKSARLAAKAQPPNFYRQSNVYQQGLFTADPDDMSDMAGDDFKSPTSRKIASGLAPIKRVWKKSEKPLEKTKETTNATLKAPEADEVGGTMSIYSSIAPSRTPDWYKDIVFTPRSEFTLKRDDILTLRRLKTIYTNYQKASSRPYSNDHVNSESNLRTFLHQLGLFDFHGKEKEIIKKSSILTDGTLTAIISSPQIPNDIRDVAQLLEARWWKGDTDPDLLRGVLRSKSSKTKTTSTASSLTSYTTYTLDPTYPFRIPADQIGHNGLHMGAWWPLQICAVRDGAHGDPEAGIHGHQDAGAFSIVVSGSGYANVDHGEMLEYCGTASSTTEMTPNTRLLITSFENKRPVRVLRSAKGDRRWSPSVGVRYDGLFVVTSWKVIDESVSLVRFTMVRSREQEGMRNEGLGRRPHAVEVEAVKRDREMRRVTV